MANSEGNKKSVRVQAKNGERVRERGREGERERGREREKGEFGSTVGRPGHLRMRGIAGEFELQRISSVVALVLARSGEGIGGDSTRKIGGKGVDNRGCGSVWIRARLRAESTAEAGRRTTRELSQQLSAQLGGFISIGTICCAK